MITPKPNHKHEKKCLKKKKLLNFYNSILGNFKQGSDL